MNQVLTLEKPPKSKFKHPFLQELIKQIRLADASSEYRNWSDELLIEQLIISSDREVFFSKNLNFETLNQLLTNAFYKAIGAIIERKTGHTTEIFVHLKSKEFSSEVIFGGRVLVLYSLIWGYRSLSFLSLSELIESAETNIRNAVTKASLYLNFIY